MLFVFCPNAQPVSCSSNFIFTGRGAVSAFVFSPLSFSYAAVINITLAKTLGKESGLRELADLWPDWSPTTDNEA